MKGTEKHLNFFYFSLFYFYYLKRLSFMQVKKKKSKRCGFEIIFSEEKSNSFKKIKFASSATAHKYSRSTP